ncbi:MAG: DUF3604 domain-containing protein [Acidimicrobiales bacterium]|nr:DUF3604 domain-containing protein [Acidimicrobiales bacterium]
MPHSTFLPEEMGTATVSPDGRFEAGSHQSFTLTYTAGRFGIDDTGSIKVVHRFASDMGKPQFDGPEAPNFVTVEASNGAVLHVEYDMKRNIRPWDKTLYIKVVRGFLSEGDQITVRFGDTRGGSPGMRLQTFCEETFEFRVLVDAIATYNYVELPDQPTITIVPGPPVAWRAVLPTGRRIGESFRLSIRGDDRWGNPSDLCDQRLTVRPSRPVEGLPDAVEMTPGRFATVVEDLTVMTPGLLVIDLVDDDGMRVATSNPMQILDGAVLLPWWGDLHGQSEETIGTNSARDFHAFARDRAFLDVTAHQGNDFQITNDFWAHLNDLTAEFTVDHRFIAFPGYEWSGNTCLGGDRNVLYLTEGQPIHRSSHALVDDLSDIETDATSASDLFERLTDRDCVVFAHIGGRYADIDYAHDERLETGVEVHSAWGSFEWLVDDALRAGYRVGILANSDGHKGRPGASHPGATKFGSFGGLTCLWATELTRAGIADALRRRHHYGTTGCRSILEVEARFDGGAELFATDPNLGPVVGTASDTVMMGDIVRSGDAEVTLVVDVVGTAPIERIEVRNGLEVIEVVRPYAQADLGRRIRVVWEGSEYRGRGRETIWDGSAELEGNAFEEAVPINRYNLDKRFHLEASDRLEWTSLTTGGHAGFEARLADVEAGVLHIRTGPVTTSIPVDQIDLEPVVFEAGGLGRRLSVFRLPDVNPHNQVHVERRIPLTAGVDDAIYVKVVQEDGHVLWSSPVYVIV